MKIGKYVISVYLSIGDFFFIPPFPKFEAHYLKNDKIYENVCTNNFVKGVQKVRSV